MGWTEQKTLARALTPQLISVSLAKLQYLSGPSLIKSGVRV